MKKILFLLSIVFLFLTLGSLTACTRSTFAKNGESAIKVGGEMLKTQIAPSPLCYTATAFRVSIFVYCSACSICNLQATLPRLIVAWSFLGSRTACGSLTGYIPSWSCGWSASQHSLQTLILTCLVLIVSFRSSFSMNRKPQRSHSAILCLPEAYLDGMDNYR